MADEKTPANGNKRLFPVIGEDSVLPIRLVSLIALISVTVGGTIWLTKLDGRVAGIATSQEAMRSDFQDLCNALGVQRFGSRPHTGSAAGP